MKRVLLVRLSAMGDVVHSLGAAEALARERPDLELHFAVQRRIAPLLENLAFLSSVLVHDRHPAFAGLWRTGNQARRIGLDVALDLQGNWKSASLCWLSRAAERIGAERRARREPSSRLLLTRGVPCPGMSHPARVALAVVRALAPQAPELPPRLVATDDEKAREAEAVRRLGIDPEQPFRIMVWSGSRDPRNWPAAAMRREAAQGSSPVVWLCGPDESIDVGEPAALVLRHEAGQVRRLVALGHVVAAAGGCVIGPDRGATHVLAACGVETRALFGPQDPVRTAPWAASALVREDGPDCVPCMRRRCHHAEGPVCMDFVSWEGRAVDVRL